MAEKKPTFFTIPNIISLARIAMIPVFAWGFLAGHEILALAVIILSGISDRLDGSIARKYNMVSEAGKMLDPLADKLTQVVLALILFLRFLGSDDRLMRFTAWVFMGFIAKEIFMLLFALAMILMKKRPAAAEIWGKAATVAFYIVMGILLLAGPDIGIIAKYFDGLSLPPVVVLVLVVLNLLLMIAAFLSYIPDTYRKVVKGEE